MYLMHTSLVSRQYMECLLPSDQAAVGNLGRQLGFPHLASASHAMGGYHLSTTCNGWISLEYSPLISACYHMLNLGTYNYT